MTKQKTIDDFHKLYYSSGNWQKTSTWAGVRVLKCPNDLFVYQEIIFRHKPTLIIETGTCYGGTTLFLAQMMDLAGIDGQVVTVDINRLARPAHSKILYIQGSSTKHHVLKQINGIAKKHKRVMAILDSSHAKSHVAKELIKYGRLVTKDQYLIVEDSNINGHPVRPDFGPGPMEAIDDFLETDMGSSFEIDDSQEKHLITFNPRGFLRKTKERKI